MKIRPVETESDDEANSSFSQFFECAWKFGAFAKQLRILSVTFVVSLPT
jgi:hypothetical protein